MMRSWVLLLVIVLLTPLSALAQSGEIGLGLAFRADGVASGDFFGAAVAPLGDVDGDGHSDVLVGAPFADPSGLDGAGSVFVLSGADGHTIRRVDGTEAFAAFGVAVAGTGDVTGDGVPDFVAGASLARPGGLIEAGYAALFSGADGTQIFRINGSAQNERLGEAVSGIGDVNSDGVPDFAVGAPESGLPFGPGAVLVFSGADRSLIRRIVDNSAQSLGTRLSRAGDVNGDGSADLIAAASGNVLIFSGSDGSQLMAVGARQGEVPVGSSVDSTGDLNGDGVPDFIAGARFFDTPTLTDAGAAFVFSGATGQRLFSVIGTQDNAEVGHAVAGPGDLDGDGVPDFAVGAPQDLLREFSEPGLTFTASAGAVDVYSGRTGARIFRVTSTDRDGRVGHSAAAAGDVNGDGRFDLLVGAPQAGPEGIVTSDGFSTPGSVFVYSPRIARQLNIDIKPRSCPNSLDLSSMASELQAAVLGESGLDLRGLESFTLQLEGRPIVRSGRLKDVGGPVPNRMDVCDCNAPPRDGVRDLPLIFSVSEIRTALGPLTAGEVRVLTLTGSLNEGTPIVARDCLVIRN